MKWMETAGRWHNCEWCLGDRRKGTHLVRNKKEDRVHHRRAQDIDIFPSESFVPDSTKLKIHILTLLY